MNEKQLAEQIIRNRVLEEQLTLIRVRCSPIPMVIKQSKRVSHPKDYKRTRLM